jgi:MFS family permease
MGRIAERFGIRFTVIFGASMVAAGLALSTWGPSSPLYIGHGLFMGLLGIGGINAPFYVYVSRWFDRRRGSALAFISSGSYLAGAFWPRFSSGRLCCPAGGTPWFTTPPSSFFSLYRRRQSC